MNHEAQQKSMHPDPSVCGNDPTLTAYMDELTKDALSLVSHSAFFTNYGEYLAMRQELANSPTRFGPLSPETAEQIDLLSDRVYLDFPVIYADGLTEAAAEAHANALMDAFRQRFAAQQHEFRVSPPTIAIEREQLFLDDCRTGEPILINGDLSPIPPGYAFASINVRIAASPAFADRLASTDDWHFLPRGPADNEALTQAIRQDLAAQGISDDPARCFSVQNSSSGETIRIMRDEFSGYYLGWTEIQSNPK